MLVVNRKFVILGLIALLQGCGPLDNYMLGKDNTPEPTELSALTNKANLALRWSHSISKPSKSSTYLKLKPVVHGHLIYTATSNGMVQATNKNTGDVVWSKQLKTNIVSGPSIGEGYVAVGTSRSTVVLLNQENGRKIKQLKVSSDALSKPLITANNVIIKTIDGNLYAFDLKTGKKQWSSEHGAPNLILKASASPVLMGKLVLVGFSDGKLDAVDAQTGHQVWQKSIAFASGFSDVERLVDIDADPIVQGNLVYLASYQGYVGALSLASGEFIWRKPASVYQNLTIDNDTLYMTDSDDVIWAYDNQNGHVKWKQNAFKARGLTEPVLVGQYLVVGDKTGYLHVLSTQTGDLMGRLRLSGPVDTSLTVSGKNIYVMTANGKLNRLTVS